MRSSTANRAFRSGSTPSARSSRVAAATVALLTFSRSRPGVRAAISLVFGVLALVNGALHLVHATDVETSGSDVTGVLGSGQGSRSSSSASPSPSCTAARVAATGARRWGYRLAVFVGGARIVYAFLFPISGAIVQTHKYREPIGAPPSNPYQPVSFTATDGLQLAGWYRSSRTAQPSYSCTAVGATGPALSDTPSSSGATGTASSSTTPAAAARAREAPSRSAGAGPKTSRACSPFSANARRRRRADRGARTSTEPTSSSRSPPSSAT